MRGLSRVHVSMQSRADRERGAVATIVSIFLAGGVIIGMLAVSVDIGNIMYERRQVQNAADATVLALASECATDASTCAADDVDDLLGANSHDNLSRFDASRPGNGVCARGGLANIDACAPASLNIADLDECTPLPDWLAAEPTIPYVETYAATRTATNGDELFLPFSRVLAGGASGDAGISACARAAWGAPDGFEGAFPLTISSCEWSAQSHDGTDFVPNGPGATGYGPGNPWPDVSKEVVLSINKGDPGVPCTDWNGGDFPGGFGWLTVDDGCQADVNEHDWVKVNPGNGPNTSVNGCSNEELDVLNKVVDIPVYDCFTGEEGDISAPPVGCSDVGNGNHTWYHLAGWAKFYVSGLKYTGGQSGASTHPDSSNECVGPGESAGCVIGWFLTGALADAPSGPLGPPEFGAYVVKPAG